MRKKNILKEAGVSIVAILMILSALVVTANSSNTGLKTETNGPPSPFLPTAVSIWSDSFDWVPTIPFPPAGWTIYDNDHHLMNWTNINIGGHGGGGCAACAADLVYNDDWLVTKKITVVGGDVFSFWINGTSSNPVFRDTFKVYNSSAGNTVDDFLIRGTLLDIDNATSIYTYHEFRDFQPGTDHWFAIRYNRSINHLATHLCLDDVHLPDGSFEGFETAGHFRNWTSGGSGNNKWNGSNVSFFPPATPHIGPWMAQYPCSIVQSGRTATLSTISPINLRYRFMFFHRSITFWMYHDAAGSPNVGDNVTLQLKIYCPFYSFTNWKQVGSPVFRNDGSSGWVSYDINLPLYYCFFKVYIGFKGNSANGNNVYIDDITVNAS